MALRIGVKFCGHCAPRMDMMELLNAVKAVRTEDTFVFYQPEMAVDALLVLNACLAQCATQPALAVPVVVVSPTTVDCWPVEAQTLCQEICQRLETL